MCKAEAIAAIEFNAQFTGNCCGPDASATPNYWQRAIGRTLLSVSAQRSIGLGESNGAFGLLCSSGF